MFVNPLQVKALFLDILEQSKSEGEQAELLTAACSQNAELRAQVELLLRANRSAGTFLETLPFPDDRVSTLSSTIIGTVIGHYRLLRQIGEGGMGIVFVAEQTQPIHRQVALKLFKVGLESRHSLARFEAEQQALALMDHPQIAKVFDTGVSASGQPYFVMEYVDGLSLTEYCHSHRLGLRDRLDLFVQICHAVQHAHRNGVIHRDLKPSNVLVIEQDGRPTPKIIDFGIAKALGTKLTQRTLDTSIGSVMGTLEYMSPEQAEGTHASIDTRSDVYSLGVLLYELLTGSTPLSRDRLKTLPFQELLRRVQEAEIERPSVRLRARAEIFCRSVPPVSNLQKLVKLVRGDLDWIVLKALEKDRSRRYEGASALAADVENFLTNVPVMASSPSPSYRFWKFARRNRGVLLATTLVVFALVGGAILSLTQMLRAVDAERLALVRLGEVEDLRKAESKQFQIAQSERLNADRMRQRAEENSRKARTVVNDSFTLVSESKLLDVPGLQPLRKQLLEGALKYYQGFALDPSASWADKFEWIASQLRVSQVYYQNNQIQDSLDAMRKGLDLLDGMPRQPQFHPQASRLAGIFRRGRLLQFFSLWPPDAVQAMQICERALKHWEVLAAQFPEILEFQSDIAQLHFRIANLQTREKRDTDALESIQKSISLWQDLQRKKPAEPEFRGGLADSQELFGMYLVSTPRHEDSLAMIRAGLKLREELMHEFPDIPNYRADLANGYRRLGTTVASFHSAAEGELILGKSVDLWNQLATEHRNASGFRKQLANALELRSNLLHKLQREAESIELKMRAAEIQTKLASEATELSREAQLDNHQEAIDSLFRLMYTLHAAGRTTEADEACERMLALHKKRIEIGSSPSVIGHTNAWLGGWYRTTGKYDASVDAFRIAAAYFEDLYVRDPRDLQKGAQSAVTVRQVADSLVGAKSEDEAAEKYEWVIARYEKLLSEGLKQPSNLWEWDFCYSNFARLRSSQGKWSDAETICRRELAACEKLARENPENVDYRDRLADIRFRLAEILRELGKTDEAGQFRSQILSITPVWALGWRSLGCARYRAGDFTAAIEPLTKCLQLANRDERSAVAAYLAMSYERLGNHSEASVWYDRGHVWLQEEKPPRADVSRLYEEAAALLKSNALSP